MAVATPTKKDLQKIAAAAKNQSTPEFTKNEDGSVDVMVHVEADDVMQLEAWADGAGEDFRTYLQKQMQGAIQSYCQS